MHELGLTQSIVEIALEHAERSGAATVLKVTVAAGDMMGIVEESLRLYYEYLTRDTIAAGSELVIERLPALVRCKSCGETSEVGAQGMLICPKCDALAVELISGREFYVDSIEIE